MVGEVNKCVLLPIPISIQSVVVLVRPSVPVYAREIDPYLVVVSVRRMNN